MTKIREEFNSDLRRAVLLSWGLFAIIGFIFGWAAMLHVGFIRNPPRLKPVPKFYAYCFNGDTNIWDRCSDKNGRITALEMKEPLIVGFVRFNVEGMAVQAGEEREVEE